MRPLPIARFKVTLRLQVFPTPPRRSLCLPSTSLSDIALSNAAHSALSSERLESHERQVGTKKCKTQGCRSTLAHGSNGRRWEDWCRPQTDVRLSVKKVAEIASVESRMSSPQDVLVTNAARSTLSLSVPSSFRVQAALVSVLASLSFTPHEPTPACASRRAHRE
ncbi:hypothetical protein B0H14DRAFT_3450354 [Mycena olivaceomarginata]|nr:hypothetical protein B0H14DRAFT_3450354 [Mycena olivaceomarginata]